MSINISFENNLFTINKLALPSRYYFFNEEQKYIKLLTIGEGLFPKDRIRTDILLQNSDVVFSTESATKIYPSKKEYAISKIKIELENSNIEFINDELILHKGAKFIQVVTLHACENSTFFYCDVLSSGRSYEEFEFSEFSAKNSFKIDGKVEYLEKYSVTNDYLKSYLENQTNPNKLFAKIYIKPNDNEKFLESLNKHRFNTFSYTKSKQMIIGVLSANNMFALKKSIKDIWKIYRVDLQKKEFNLGKQ